MKHLVQVIPAVAKMYVAQFAPGDPDSLTIDLVIGWAYYRDDRYASEVLEAPYPLTVDGQVEPIRGMEIRFAESRSNLADQVKREVAA